MSKSSNGNTLLWVYGTLKRGFGNNGFLSNSKFLKEIKTKNNSVLIVRGLPFFLGEHPDGLKVCGELYEVIPEDLCFIDVLEGHPHAYTRDKIELEDGNIAETYYYYNSSFNVKPSDFVEKYEKSY